VNIECPLLNKKANKKIALHILEHKKAVEDSTHWLEGQQRMVEGAILPRLTSYNFIKTNLILNITY